MLGDRLAGRRGRAGSLPRATSTSRRPRGRSSRRTPAAPTTCKRFYGIDATSFRPHFDVVVNTDVLSPDRAGEVVVAAAGH